MERKRVLTIENDWRMRRLIQANLEARGLEVRGAVNGRHGLQLASEDEPDLIVVDVDLPDMEAVHLLDRLHAQLDGQVPIIILSSEPPTQRVRQNDHRLSYLQKPFSAPALLQQAQEALGSVGPDTGQVNMDG